MTSGAALKAMKRAAAAGRIYLDTGDLVFSLLCVIDVVDAIEGAVECHPQGHDWMLDTDEFRLVIRLVGRDAVVVGCQT